MALNPRLTQGIAGFLVVSSGCLFLFFLWFGYFAVLVASAILLIGTVLKFRIWVPAVAGGGLGLLAAVATIIFAIIISAILGFAVSGG
jgi:hypothetical protein